MHHNVQGLFNKFEDVEINLRMHDPDVFCVSEHWILSDIPVPLLGYTTCIMYYRKKFLRGGVAILAKCNLRFEVLTFIDAYCKEKDFECVGIKLIDHSILIFAIYRSPDGDLDHFFNGMFEVLSFASRITGVKIVITGDLNIDYLQNSRDKCRLMDVLSCFDLISLINEPTRVACRSQTAIDYFIVSSNVLEGHDCEVRVTHSDVSDHTDQLLCLRGPLTVKHGRESDFTSRYHFSDVNLSRLLSEMRAESWGDVYASRCLHIKFSIFIDTFLWYINMYCPLRTIERFKNTARNPWIVPALRKESNDLRMLFKLKNDLNDDHMNDLYRHEKKKHKYNIKQAKKTYYENRILDSDDKNKEIWRVVNLLTGGGKIREAPILLRDNSMVRDHGQVADMFVDYFASAAQDDLNSFYAGNIPTATASLGFLPASLFLRPVSGSELYSVLNSMKNKRSTGPDRIPIKVIKICFPLICDVLAHIINFSLEVGAFPDSLKMSIVTPLYKKGDPLSCESYRPISLLSCFSKLFERVMHSRLYAFLNRYDVLSKTQHGFRPSYSTGTATVQLMDEISRCLDKGVPSLGIFFDLSKAFDTIDHGILLDKLYASGIRGVVYSWFRSYLTNRQMYVCIGGANSITHVVKRGIPQGSVLGPLLFLIYCNDLSRFVTRGSLVQFADDTTIVVSGPSADVLEAEGGVAVAQFSDWCWRNLLLLNVSKTSYITFKRTYQEFNVQLNMHRTPLVGGVGARFLGTYVDEHVRWSSHIDHLCKQLNRTYFILINLRRVLSEEVLLTVYYSMAYSHIRYNVVLFGQAVDWKRVFVCQKRLIRVIYNIPYRHTCRTVFMSKRIMTFPSIYILECALFVRKHRSNPAFSDEFGIVGAMHSHCTRQVNNIYIQRYRTNIYKKSAICSAGIIYNRLPTYLKAFSGEKFVKQLKEFLIQECYYSLEEFLK